MTFDEWWADNQNLMPSIVKIDAREVWFAATKSEQDRCRKAVICAIHSLSADDRKSSDILIHATNCAILSPNTATHRLPQAVRCS